MITRTFIARTYHYCSEFGDTYIRVRPDGRVWFFPPNKRHSIFTRSQAAAVILALDATQVRGCDFRSR